MRSPDVEGFCCDTIPMTEKTTPKPESPDGWIDASVEDVLLPIRGISFPKEAKRNQVDRGLVACLRTANIQDEVDWSDLWFVSQEFVRREEQYIAVGDILISVSNSLNLLGKVALVKAVPFQATLGTFIANLRAKEPIESRLVYYYLCSMSFKQDVRNQASTTTNISNISVAKLEKLRIPLPPLPEQHRIVAKIEELFSDLDASVAALLQAQAHLRIYRQAVLKYAFDGRLTERWREQHAPPPASELLAQIQAEREQRYRQQLAEWKADVHRWEAAGKVGRKPAKPRQPEEVAPLSAGEMEELGELPEGWAWAKLRDISEIVGGITKGRDFSGQPTVRLPYLRVANVQDGYLDLADVRDIEALPTELEKYRLEPGDILYTEGGDKDKLGRGAVWQGEIPNCIHQNHIFRARVFQHLLNADFIALNSQTKGAKHYFFSNAKQTVNLASINMTVLGNLPVPIPGTSEQQAIVAEIEARLSVVDKLEETLAAALRQAEALRQSILQRAFAGKLVPQDPSDEPAQQLLERIRKARQDQLL